MTGQAPLQSRGSGDFVNVTVDVAPVLSVLREAPKIVYFRARDFMFQILLQHRNQWLAIKGNKFGRGGGGKGEPIRVRQINDGKGPALPNDVAYAISPSEKRAPSPEAAATMLGKLSADIFTGNVILPIHEFGEDIASANYMAVPVKTRPGSPARWRAKYPDRRLRALPSKINNNVPLYEVSDVRARGRVKKGEQPVTRERLRLRFILTKRVDMKPTLHLYDTWDVGYAERDKLWAAAASKMQSDWEKNDPRDRS